MVVGDPSLVTTLEITNSEKQQIKISSSLAYCEFCEMSQHPFMCDLEMSISNFVLPKVDNFFLEVDKKPVLKKVLPTFDE